MLLDCITVFLDPQCIVSQEDLQHKILNWSTFLPSGPYIQVGQERGGGTMRTVSQPAWIHLRCISETSHAVSQRYLKEG